MELENKPVNTKPIVLITRPDGQNAGFASECQRRGLQTRLLPCLQIIASDIDASAWRSQLPQHDIALFTSANAVHFAHRLLPLPWNGIHVHAIGAATARVLHGYGQCIAVQPAEPFNSEAYIAQIRNLPPQHLLLVKGVGGRGLVSSSLQALGWQVQSMDVYERILPSYSAQQINEIFTGRLPDIVSVTSNETLENLWSLCAQYRHLLVNCSLLCNSDRCAAYAGTLGFVEPPMVAVPAGDSGQLACLDRWLTRQSQRMN